MPVQASHILCKHTESRNPLSRRTGQTITITKSDAMKEITMIHTQLLQFKGTNELFQKFSVIAKNRSDCGSFQNDGDLGIFERGQMQQPFEEGTFSLEIGEMSTVIDTDSGLHLIFRTA